MKITHWFTPHEISQRVHESVNEGLIGGDNQIGMYSTAMFHDFKDVVSLWDCHIGYGILRGTGDVFRECERQGKPYFNIDKGYINPHHYSGSYRVSLRGTQQTTGLDKLKPDYNRLGVLGVKFKPWRGLDESKPVLIIPPTDYVREFFGILSWPNSLRMGTQYVWRNKGDTSSINFDDYSHVVTFNSSVGWQAIAAGIPCISDPTHSFVGAYYKQLLGDNYNVTDILAKTQHDTRHELFGCMASLQLTLDEMRQGKIWELMTRLMSLSDTIVEKPSALTSQPIPSPSALAFQSIYTT